MYPPTAPAAALDLNRPRSFGELLGTVFTVWGRHFGVFAAISFAVVIPVDAIFFGGMLGWFTSYDPTPPPETNLIATIASTLIIQPLIIAMHVTAVLEIGEGRKPGLKEVFARGGDLFVPVLGALLLVWLFFVLGFIALIIPGIYIATRLSVAAPAVVVEGQRGMGAVRRSWDLVKDNWWRVFGVLAIVGIASVLGGNILAAPGLLISDAIGNGMPALIAQIVAQALLNSLQALAATLIYFDLKARKEMPAAAHWAVPPEQAYPPGPYQPPPPGVQPPPEAPPPPPPERP
jgi:hypothetical protein